jgi:hypothetical protein
LPLVAAPPPPPNPEYVTIPEENLKAVAEEKAPVLSSAFEAFESQ